MAFVTKSDDLKRKVGSKKWLVFTIMLGLIFIFIPILFIFIDPVLIVAKYYLRLANGTMLHDIMLHKVNGPRFYVSLFNFTNAKDYISGKDEKMKLEEIGPFVYQEYRLNYDLRIDPETNLMKYTPQLWAELILEESIADPKDMYFTMPCVTMLLGADMLSKYPFFIRNMYNIFAASLNAKAVIDITAHEYLWGYPDPIMKFISNMIPGVFYYNSIGIMERIYDMGANYTLEIGANDEEKFVVKRVTKKYHYINKEQSDNLMEDVQTFTDSYEGVGFPPGMTQDKPIYIYRYSLCKSFRLEYVRTKTTEHGTEVFVYDVANDTLNDRQLCYSTGSCPSGLLNLAPCYKNYQFAMSKGHFLDADPRLLDKFEGIKPDKKLHSTEFIVDPKIGIALSSTTSIQVNLFLGDLGYSPATRRFKDTVMPLCHAILDVASYQILLALAFKDSCRNTPSGVRLQIFYLKVVAIQASIRKMPYHHAVTTAILRLYVPLEARKHSSKHPELPPQAQYALNFMYIYGPCILLTSKIICVILGLALLAYSSRIIYLISVENKSVVLDSSAERNLTNGYIPLNMWQT